MFKPQRLGTVTIPDAELTTDKKNCKKIGPCGVGEKAIYLNSFYFDRRYYIPISSVERIFKRIAMSKGGFTGKGAFGTLSYLVVVYENGKEKQCNFKHEEDVDRIGVALAMIGVIVCPITSGDTAFRSARLVLADWFKIDQNKLQKRLILCVPLLAVGAFVGHLDYAIVWRYFSWTNQTLAMIVLWTASMYLFREKKNYWITAVPATFMSAVSMTYFFCADECLGFSTAVAYPVGIILAALFLGIFIWATRKPARKQA